MNNLEINTCQCCGTKMHHLVDFGSNADGTINTEYCQDCYVKGVFVNHGIPLEQKIERDMT